jgi:hypothetical protein
MARATSNAVPLTDTEPQYTTRLCWAAADVLAVNHFYPNCPAPTSTPPPPPPLYPTSQALEGAYHMWVKSGGVPPQWDTTGAAALSWYVSKVCEPQIGNCDDWGIPPLNGLTFKWGSEFPNAQHPDPLGLDWPTMTQEINAGHPVLFVWNYASDGTSPNSPVGNHQLVVTGYSDDTGTQQLQIWDPWPVPDPLPSKVPECGPASGVQATDTHSRQIPFSTYRTPVNDIGVPVTAVHYRDQWGLTMGGQRPPPVPNPPVVTVDEGPPPAPPPPPPPFPKPSAVPSEQSFAKALSMALPASRKLDLQISGAAPRTLGVPFPIVGLGFVQLLRAADDPTRLLAGNTSAILFPVESQGQVVDAYLLLFMRGGWQRGGYANIEITRRLVNVRAAYAARQHLPLENFYMVSVPGEVAFFAAYGKGKKAILIPASSDPTIGAFAGVPVPANRQLRELILVIQRDLLRHPEAGRSPVRRP